MYVQFEEPSGFNALVSISTLGVWREEVERHLRSFKGYVALLVPDDTDASVDATLSALSDYEHVDRLTGKDLLVLASFPTLAFWSSELVSRGDLATAPAKSFDRDRLRSDASEFIRELSDPPARPLLVVFWWDGGATPSLDAWLLPLPEESIVDLLADVGKAATAARSTGKSAEEFARALPATLRPQRFKHAALSAASSVRGLFDWLRSIVGLLK